MSDVFNIKTSVVYNQQDGEVEFLPSFTSIGSTLEFKSVPNNHLFSS